jgi:uncharacterized RDD family membrane protein YckC
MTCSYCGARNGETEHRCRRCGRKPGDTLNGELTFHRTTGALATKPRRTAVLETPIIVSSDASDSRDLSGAVQFSLFTPNVIPISAPRAIPHTKGPTPPGVHRPVQRPEASASVSGIRPPVRRAPRVVEGQGELEFLAPMPLTPRTLSTTVDARIFCDATAATPLHRAVAAALDWSMVLIGYGLFLAFFYLGGGAFYLTRNNLLTFGAALLLIRCAYGLFWTIAGTESAGMRWTHLRLITFEGFPPDQRHRLMRFAGSGLSFFTIVGALWALADEESLGWQDHISKTFPTADDLKSCIFLRR